MPERDEQHDRRGAAPDGASPDASAKPLTPAARRALEEAARRRADQAGAPAPPPEINGRGGLEPTRYGDWDVKGLASDF